MASFEEALRTELAGITGLTNKVFPLTAPPGTTAPYVVYETSTIEDKAMEGFLSTVTTSVTLDLVATSYATLKSLTALVKIEIKSWLQSTMSDGPYIQNITFGESSPELYEPEVNLYRRVMDFTVYY